MAVRTKPQRVFEEDHATLRFLANLKSRSTPEFVHELLEEYLAKHGPELAAAFSETQAAIAAGDLDALTRMFAASAQAQADEMLKNLPPRS
jgi:hypothetical protein